jgi:hypothetical protein
MLILSTEQQLVNQVTEAVYNQYMNFLDTGSGRAWDADFHIPVRQQVRDATAISASKGNGHHTAFLSRLDSRNYIR